MIEAYDSEGRYILLNPKKVVEVYYSGASDHFNMWCNVKTTSGTLHRFTGTNAKKVYDALKTVEI